MLSLQKQRRDLSDELLFGSAVFTTIHGCSHCSLIALIPIQVKRKVYRVIALYLQNWPEALENDSVGNLQEEGGGRGR